MAEKRYRIQHPDGRAYDVAQSAFTKIYEPQGFEIVANADGTAVERPKAAPKQRGRRDRSAAARKGVVTRRARADAAAAASAIAIDSSAAADDPDEEPA